MTNQELRQRLYGVVALATDYCVTLENASETPRNEFLVKMLNLLPRLYLEFLDIAPDARRGNSVDTDAEEESEYAFDEFSPVRLEEDEEPQYFSDYVDEDYYDSVRRHIEGLLGPDDVYLETFEEDMKYSDTPIGASISESLADIFQTLYNFISVVKDSEGEHLEPAYKECRENFTAYWGQTLCNVMRALNNVYFNYPERD